MWPSQHYHEVTVNSSALLLGGQVTSQLVEASVVLEPALPITIPPGWSLALLLWNRTLHKPKISPSTQNNSEGLKYLRGCKFSRAPLGSQWSLFGFSRLPEKNHLSNKKCLSPSHPSTADTSLSQKSQIKITMHRSKDYTAAKMGRREGKRRSWPSVFCVGTQEVWINTWW